MANAGKLLWTETSYIVFVQVYHWLPETLLLGSFIDIEDLCYIVEHHFISPHLSGYAYMTGNRVLELLCWTSWLSILSYNIDQVLTTIDFVEYRLMFCSRTLTHAKSLTCLWLQWRRLGFFADLSPVSAVVHRWPLLPTVVCVCIMYTVALL